ncbi:hypothetical protein [Halobacillus amylolyticus]|uniref:Uncharacterized protein n=1 Tax=Halobacillus amylolyticus TaxID=2932259 RepID=A0ABY4HE26_9BACI|nr:hypothetical protein [Halobacillus amylolyticus]UOR13119.1 hypothetical protein MUO15_06430 [Halobacillus amylolyticus]
MKRWVILGYIPLFILLIMFHIFGLMFLFPLYITAPLLFVSIYMFIALIYHKKKFRGFIK